MRAGPLGLGATGTSIGLTILIALLGPSALEPALAGPPGQPPYSLVTHPSAYFAVALAAAAIGTGTLGLGLCMRAARRGWAPSPRMLLIAGIGVAGVLAFLPPFGSADHLSYAGYGRMLVTGHDPYATGPGVLGADPIGRAVEDWRTTPSVYGPLATGAQALAAVAGGTSVRLTVFVLSLENLSAFAGAALLLHRLARRDRGRELRAALLWTANPLLLHELMAGAHVDVQAAVFAAAAVAVFPPRIPNGSARWRTACRCVAAGALTGLGAAVKLTAALAGGGLAWTARRRWGWLVGLAAGFVAVAATALVLGGPHVLAQTMRGGSFVSIGSPWRVTRTVLTAAFGAAAAHSLISVGSLVLAVFLLTVLLRGLPVAQRGTPAAEPDQRTPPAVSAAAPSPAVCSGGRPPAASAGTGPPPVPPGRRPDAPFGTTAPGPDPDASPSVLSPSGLDQPGEVAGPPGSAGAAGGLTAEPPAARAALAFALAWLFAWPYVLPWYDALAWVVLPMIAWSWVDWLVLARTAALAIGYLPARSAVHLPTGLGWLQSVVRTAVTPAILAALTVLAVVACVRGRRRLLAR